MLIVFFTFTEPQPEPIPDPLPEPPMNDEEQYDIPEPPDAEHVGPHTEEEVEEYQKQLEKHEEDWQAKQEKVRFDLPKYSFVLYNLLSTCRRRRHMQEVMRVRGQ